VEQWIRWWRADPSIDASKLPPHNAESAAFISAWAALAAGKPLPAPSSFAWAKAYGALRFAADSSPKALVPGDTAFQKAVGQRAAKYSSDLRAFLIAPTGDEPALLTTYRRTRRGYGFLARHPDGPFLADAYIVQENRVTTTFASGLFPRKGSVPGRYLLALMSRLER
jgi:hypothetical protein